MGASRAAGAAAFLLEHYQPRVIIAAGFGGAVTPELPRGGLVLGETFWRYEPETGKLQGLAAPAAPVALAEVLARLNEAGRPAFRGSMVTTPGIIHKFSQGGPLLGLVHPVLDLETSVLADYARDRGLPFLAVRAVTDAAGEEIPAFIRQAAGAGKTPGLAAVLTWAARDPRRLAELVGLWRREPSGRTGPGPGLGSYGGDALEERLSSRFFCIWGWGAGWGEGQGAADPGSLSQENCFAYSSRANTR